MTDMRTRHLQLAMDAATDVERNLHQVAARLHGEAYVSELHRRNAVAATARAFDPRLGGTMLAMDAGFSEGDHPRADNGQFGSGGGGSSKSGTKKFKVKLSHRNGGAPKFKSIEASSPEEAEKILRKSFGGGTLYKVAAGETKEDTDAPEHSDKKPLDGKEPAAKREMSTDDTNAQSVMNDIAKEHENRARWHSKGGNTAQAAAHRAARDLHKKAGALAESHGTHTSEYRDAHHEARASGKYANRIG